METVLQEHYSTTLQLIFDLEMVGDKMKTRTKTFSDVKQTAAKEDLYEVANSIAGLQIRDLSKIYTTEKNQLKPA